MIYDSFKVILLGFLIDSFFLKRRAIADSRSPFRFLWVFLLPVVPHHRQKPSRSEVPKFALDLAKFVDTMLVLSGHSWVYMVCNVSGTIDV